MAPTGNGGVYRARPVDLYERKLKEAGVCAHIIAILYAFSQFLAYCNLTLSTVALLGGFASKLHSRDYAYVISLILVEGARVTAASVFMRLLIAPSEHPTTHIPHSRSGGQNALSARARLYSNVLQFILIIPSFLLPCLGHKYLNYGSSTDIQNLQMSLQIFYILVAINAMVALFYLLCSLCSFVALSMTSERSVLRYLDKYLEIAMNSTLGQAHIEFFQFAYTLLGSEFRQNVEPEAVAENHTMMIEYMYAHRLGVDFLEIYLDADDEFVQLAAVNMVGFWADKTWKVGLPKGVLTKLADKVSTTRGQVGWAAITSFSTLGASSPTGAHIVATTRTSSGMPLPDRLAELINGSSALSLVRTLVRFYEQLCVDVKEPSPKPFGEEAEAMLVAKLELLARGAEEQCIRVQAAYLLLLMGEGWKEEVVLGIEPRKDIYWFESELMMLALLRSHTGRALLPLQLPFLRQDAPITPPAWAIPQRAHG